MAAIRLDTDALIAGYAALATIVHPEALTPTAPDPDDDVVIATALAARAEIIVTGDHPFLNLAAFRSIRIIDIREALSILLENRPAI